MSGRDDERVKWCEPGAAHPRPVHWLTLRNVVRDAFGRPRSTGETPVTDCGKAVPGPIYSSEIQEPSTPVTCAPCLAAPEVEAAEQIVRGTYTRRTLPASVPAPAGVAS